MFVKLADLFDVDGGLRQLQIKIVERIGDDVGNRQIAKPFVICRDDEPGRMFGRAARQGRLEGLDVVVPFFALGIVAGADLPLVRRIVEPRLETLELFFFGDVEKEFQNGRLVLDGEELFPFVDEVVARLPHLFWRELVHAYDEHVFVMRAIEDRNVAALRRMRMDAPQKVVRLFFGSRLLEPGHLHALRVHGADDMPAGAVLAGAVDALQNDQQRMRAVRVEFALQLGYAREIALQLLRRFGVIRIVAMKTRIDRSEIDVRTGLDAELFDEFHVLRLLRPVALVQRARATWLAVRFLSRRPARRQ